MAAGDPTGADLVSVTVDADTMPTTQIYTTFTFDSPYLIFDNFKYAIVVEVSTVDLANKLEWGQDTAAGYAGGLKCISDDDGSTWTQVVIRDCAFRTRGPSGQIRQEFNITDAWQAIYVPFSVAQTFTAGNTNYFLHSVDLRIRKTTASPSGTMTVSLRAVEGEVYPTSPTKAENPSPTDTNTSVTLDQATISWDDGGGADTFDVYYGTVSGSLSLVSLTQAGTSFTVTGVTDGSPYTYLSTRYWRINSTNVAGTTTGDEWSFTTIRLDPPTPTRFYPVTGQYYYLLIQSDGTYGDLPGVGVENTDYVFLAAGYEANFIATNRRLVAAAENKIWYEAI